MASRKVVLKVAGISGGVLLGLLLVAAFALIALSRPVDGHSMDPTLHNGDRLVVTPGSGGKVNRFDVVELKEKDETIVKRVIAVPGDRVEITASSTSLYVVLLQKGGTGPWYQVREPAWTGQATMMTYCCEADGTSGSKPRIQTVPAGKFFFLGDNPDVSEDARRFGWGSIADVQGRVGLRVWPLGAAKGIGDAPTLVETATPAS
jgi:signal peptidase I